LIKKRALAARLGVSPRTIDTWLRHRLIPVVKPSARLCLFDAGAVKAALDRRFGVREEGR
jgi:predicted site-specific integrase-resolvase